MNTNTFYYFLSERWLGQQQEEHMARWRFYQSWCAFGKSLSQAKEGELRLFQRCAELLLYMIFQLERFFYWVSKVIARLLWFCITKLCDWLTKLAPLFQPMRSKTKTNRASLARVFARLAPVTCIFFEFWLVHCAACVCCDWPDWFLWLWVLQHSIENHSVHYRSMWKFCSAYPWIEVGIVRKRPYSQLSPCGHLAITDTLIIRTATKIPCKNKLQTFDWNKFPLLRTLAILRRH